MNCPLCDNPLTNLVESCGRPIPIVSYCNKNTNGKYNNLTGSHYIHNTNLVGQNDHIIMIIENYRIINYCNRSTISKRHINKINFSNICICHPMIKPEAEEKLLNKIETMLLFF